MSAISGELSKKILEVVPPCMERLREELRSSCGNISELSVPQLRVLGCIKRDLVLVGDIAKHQGVSQPAMSKMVDVLVDKGYVERFEPKKDRRQVPLRLTKRGSTLYAKIWQSAEVKIVESHLPKLSHEEQLSLLKALDLLKTLFLT